MIEPGQYDLDNPIFHRGVTYGKALENERIIALLEETAYCGSHNELIALIKGQPQ
jgi:hypothetical protein